MQTIQTLKTMLEEIDKGWLLIRLGQAKYLHSSKHKNRAHKMAIQCALTGSARTAPKKASRRPEYSGDNVVLEFHQHRTTYLEDFCSSGLIKRLTRGVLPCA